MPRDSVVFFSDKATLVMARLSRERQIQNLERTWKGGLGIRSLAKLEKECQPAHGNHLGRFPEGFRSFECLPYLGSGMRLQVDSLNP